MKGVERINLKIVSKIEFALFWKFNGISPEIAHLGCSFWVGKNRSRITVALNPIYSGNKGASGCGERARFSRRRRLRDSQSTTPRNFRHHRQNCAVLLAGFLVLVTRVSEVPRCGNGDCITHLSSAKSCLAEIVAGPPSEENLRAAAFHGDCITSDVRILESRSFSAASHYRNIKFV